MSGEILIYEEKRFIQEKVEVTLINHFPELQGFGLEISGGKDRPYFDDDPGIFVSAVKENGIAERSGKVHLNDKIIEVNEHNILNITHDEAVQLFISDRTKVNFVLEKYNEPFSLNDLIDSVEEEEKPLVSSNLKQNLILNNKSVCNKISLSGFLCGLALGCVGVVLIKRCMS